MKKVVPLMSGIATVMLLATTPAQALKYSVEHTLTSPSATNYATEFGGTADIDGDTVVVGQKSDDEAHIFQRQEDGNWAHLQTLPAPVGEFYPSTAYFGYEVAIDGDTIAVSDNEADGPQDTHKNAGVVYLYRRQADGTWVIETTLGVPVDADKSGYNYFGTTIAMKDGVMVICSPHDGGVNHAGFKEGSCYLYTQDQSGSWNYLKRLVSASPTDYTYLGTSVATDGTRVIVGGPASGNMSATEGVAYIYEVGSDSVTELRTPATDSNPDMANLFGYGVEIFGDMAFVGAPGFNEPASDAGKVYAYHYTDAGGWQLLDELSYWGLDTYDGFGRDIEFDGNDLVISATNYVDKLYYYQYDSSSQTFTQQRSWQAQNVDSGSGDSLGMHNIAFNGEGHLMATAGSSDEVFIFEPEAELELVVQDNIDPVEPDTSFSYTLYVTNNDSEVTATGIKVSGNLPSGFSLVSADPACIYDATTTVWINCSVDQLTPTASISFALEVQAADSGEFTFSPTLTADRWLADASVLSDSETTVVGSVDIPVAEDPGDTITPTGEETPVESSGGGGGTGWIYLLALFGLLLHKAWRVTDESYSHNS